MDTYHPFIDSCLYENNIWHSMLALNKDNTNLLYNKPKKSTAKNMLASLVIHNSSVTDV